MVSPVALAKELLAIIHTDIDRLERIDNYLHGIQDEPYMPKTADSEYKHLAKRAISNWMPLLVNTPAQALYVDAFRAGHRESDADSEGTNDERSSPEWEHWQNSRLDARQVAVHRAALTYGHSFTVTEISKDGLVHTKGLSPLRTAALYEDPANDHDPFAALTVTHEPNAANKIKGRARLWDGTKEYQVLFEAYLGEQKITIPKRKSHGAPECPVTRFAAVVDLEGRTTGVIEPMIPLQNRINQTVFDLLVAQTYGSFKVRWATGMAPPTRTAWLLNRVEVEEGTEGAVKAQIPIPMDYNAKRFLFADDEKAKFGSLDETSLDGYISSIDMSVRHLAAVSQTPPHHLLGQIANLSAEALQAAETSLSRKVEEYRKMFGESWERVFRLAGAMSGDEEMWADYSGEVLWRDMEQRSLAQSADALGKMADQLDIPKRGLWPRIPNVTQNEIDHWMDLREDDDFEQQMAESLTRASGIRAETPAKADAEAA